MGVMQKRASKKREKPARKVRAEQREAQGLDEWIEFGRAALEAPGVAPLAMQLDTALQVAGLYLRRAARAGAPENAEDLRWAVSMASFVAEQSQYTPSAAVIELNSRAIAILELCAPQLPDNESVTVQGLATRSRDRLERAQHVYALSLDEAIASLTIGKALLANAPAADDREVVVGRARALLTGAAIAARRAGNEPLANAALSLIEAASTPARTPAEEPKKRRGFRNR